MYLAILREEKSGSDIGTQLNRLDEVLIVLAQTTSNARTKTLTIVVSPSRRRRHLVAMAYGTPFSSRLMKWAENVCLSQAASSPLWSEYLTLT